MNNCQKLYVLFIYFFWTNAENFKSLSLCKTGAVNITFDSYGVIEHAAADGFDCELLILKGLPVGSFISFPRLSNPGGDGVVLSVNSIGFLIRKDGASENYITVELREEELRIKPIAYVKSYDVSFDFYASGKFISYAIVSLFSLAVNSYDIYSFDGYLLW